MLYFGTGSLFGLSDSVSTGIAIVLSVYWNRIANCWRESQSPLFHPKLCNHRGLCCDLRKPPFVVYQC